MDHKEAIQQKFDNLSDLKKEILRNGFLKVAMILATLSCFAFETPYIHIISIGCCLFSIAHGWIIAYVYREKLDFRVDESEDWNAYHKNLRFELFGAVPALLLLGVTQIVFLIIEKLNA